MAYQKLALDPATPPTVRRLVERLEGLFFGDVHTMLRLPIPNYRLNAGCNFAIAQVLAAAISGVSVTLYSHTGGKGHRFKSLLIDYYPWNREPASVITPQTGAETIYSIFRNPLTHDLGLDIEKKARTPTVKIKRLSTKNKTRGLPEKKIEQLESTMGRFNMSAALTIRSDATVLLVEALYWGIRSMVETISRDQTRMAAAETFLVRL